MNFSGLGNGVLPAGTVIAFLDCDLEEQINEMHAYDAASNRITSQWMTPISGTAGFFDFSFHTLLDSQSDMTGLLDPLTTSCSNGYFFLRGPASNQTSSFAGYVINQDISLINYEAGRYSDSLRDGGAGTAIALLAPVPEPLTMTALLPGLAYLAKRRKRK
jgi:hypothetical protein